MQIVLYAWAPDRYTRADLQHLRRHLPQCRGRHGRYSVRPVRHHTGPATQCGSANTHSSGLVQESMRAAATVRRRTLRAQTTVLHGIPRQQLRTFTRPQHSNTAPALSSSQNLHTSRRGTVSGQDFYQSITSNRCICTAAANARSRHILPRIYPRQRPNIEAKYWEFH